MSYIQCRSFLLLTPLLKTKTYANSIIISLYQSRHAFQAVNPISIAPLAIMTKVTKETHVESLHTSLVLWCQFCSWDTECWLPTAIRCYKCSFSRMNRKGMQPRWCCLLVCWTRIKFNAFYCNWLVTCRQITHAYLQWKLWIKVPGRGSKGKLQRDDSLGSFSELQIDSKTSSICRKDVGIQDSAQTQGTYSIFRSCFKNFKKKHHFHHVPIRNLRSFYRVCSWSVNGGLIQVSFSLDLGVLPQLFFIN